jgi:hypothetical protein
LLDAAKNLHAVHVRHLEIEKDGVKAVRLGPFEAVTARCESLDFNSLLRENPVATPDDHGFVVDNQNFWIGDHRTHLLRF